MWGLYAGYTNAVTLTFTFTDGSQSLQTVNITTASYVDPCTQLDSGTLTQNRVNTSDLNFDFFLLKSVCSGNAPTLIDTDANIRWVGQPGTGTVSVAIYNNALYMSDLKTGILRTDLTTVAVTKVGDYAAAPYNVTYTGHHNIDPGRNGLIVDVNTTTELEATDLEFNPYTGAVENFWDLGQIITYAMTKGGDDPTKFVFGAAADWFHNNATTYNPADNTLIVSSRENFVMAVDYDTPADGQKKIHWILGDSSKAWYQFPSLRAFVLTPTNAATLPPIGATCRLNRSQRQSLAFRRRLPKRDAEAGRHQSLLQCCPRVCAQPHGTHRNRGKRLLFPKPDDLQRYLRQRL